MNSFETKIQQHIIKLTTTSYPQLEAEVADKRLNWFAGRSAEFRIPPPTPRAAYEFLLRDYMGLDLADLPVIEESEDEIVWLSRNPCPTHQACVRVGLDTRLVCRAVYERSTQVLISRLDPQLRFLRSYTDIRPHAEACREWLVRVDFNAALAEAEAAVSDGSTAAIVLLGQRRLACAGGPACSAAEPDAHPVRTALAAAAAARWEHNLCGTVLFCSGSACPACMRAAAEAGVTGVVRRPAGGETPGYTWIEEFPAFAGVVNAGPARL